MNIFLKAKHWHLFIILFVIPLLLYTFIVTPIYSEIIPLMNDPENLPDPAAIQELFMNQFKYMPIFIVVSTLPLWLWQWSIATLLQEKIPQKLQMKTNLFKASMIFPFIYFMLLFVIISYLFSNIFQEGFVPDEDFVFNMFKYIPIIMTFHFLSLVCIIYNMYFVAKTLKLAETQKKVTFGDFVGEFFLIWFFIIGVWVLQPKINEFVKEEILPNRI